MSHIESEQTTPAAPRRNRGKTQSSTVPPLQEEELVDKRMDVERDALFGTEEPVDELKMQNAAKRQEENAAFTVPEEEMRAGQEFETRRIEDESGVRTFVGIHGPQIDDIVRIVAAQVGLLGAQMRDELLSLAATRDNGISARMVGGAFDCPECGLRLSSPSLTSQTGGLYEHPWSESQKIGNKPCRLKGMKFRAPVVFLEATKPMPLTDGKE